MEIAKKILITLLISVSGFAQTSNFSIEISYNKKLFNKIAEDSIRQIYNNQFQYYEKNEDRANKVNAISEKVKFEDLSFYSLPKYRLKKDAAKMFNCKSNIESFIEFDENIKYQDVIILNDKSENICMIDIPNFYYEQSRINNPDLSYSFGKRDYDEQVLEKFLYFPESYINKQVWKNITDRKNNFFFTVYGVQSVLFEVEQTTGLVYANWVGTGSNRDKRMLANDYIRKFIGKKSIQKFASGEYDSGDFSAPCKTAKKLKRIMLKVKIID